MIRILPPLFVVAFCPVLKGATVSFIELATSGIYDEQSVATNTVERTVEGAPLTVAAFSAAVLNAYNSNLGGVIHFDNLGVPSKTDSSELRVTYGLSATGLLTITKTGSDISGALGNFYFEGNSAVGTQISGGATNSYFLRNLGRNDGLNGTQGFAFSTPLSALGFTVLSRSGSRNITATAYLSDSSTAVLTATIANGAGTDDTFFSFQAPEGKSITSLVVTAGTDANSFFAIDDFAFIVPEPSVIGLSAIGLLGLVVRRSRR